MHFDYTPLSQKVSYKELWAYFKQLPKDQKITLAVAGGIDTFFIVAAFVALPGMFTGFESGSVDDVQTNFFWVFFGVIALVLPFGYLYSQQEAIRLKRFSLLNNLTYYDGPLDEYKNGLIFQYGHTKGFDYVFSLKNNHIQEFGAYHYTTGSGKSSQLHSYGFVRVKLPRALPNMVLDSRENNLFGQSGLPKTVNKDQVLELEGNFNEYFTLYAPKEYARDALYIFTPDVMQAMIDAPNRYDGEIVDDDFYLYTNKLDIHDADVVEELLSIADRIAGQLDKQANNYKDERVVESVDDAIAPAGVRLRVASPASQAVMVIASVFIAYLVIVFLYYR